MSSRFLVLGSLGICGLLGLGALMQQYMIFTTYSNGQTEQKQRMNFPNAFILAISTLSWALSTFMLRNDEDSGSDGKKASPKFLKVRALLIFAIYLTGIPFAMMFKACSGLLRSTVIVSANESTREKLLNKNRHRATTAGVILTLLIFSYNGFDDKPVNLIGIELLLISMLCDCVLPLTQIKNPIKQETKLTPTQEWNQLSQYLIVISVVYALASFQIFAMAKFFMDHLDCLAQIGACGAFVAIGYGLVCEMIGQFDRNVLDFVKAIRKIMTIVISLIAFSHHASALIYLSLIGITIAIGFNFYRSQKRRLFLQNYTKRNKYNVSLLDDPVDITEKSAFKIEVDMPNKAIVQQEWSQRYDMLKMMEEIYPPSNVIDYYGKNQYECQYENPEDICVVKGKEEDLMREYESLSGAKAMMDEREENLSTDSSKD